MLQNIFLLWSMGIEFTTGHVCAFSRGLKQMEKYTLTEAWAGHSQPL